MIDPDSAPILQFLRRFGALAFLGLLGAVLCVFTAFDVFIFYLARKRKGGFGARPWRGALWQFVLAPTRHAFWAVGFWVALAVLCLLLLRLFGGGALSTLTAPVIR